MERVVEKRPVDDVFRTVVFGAHAGNVDIGGRWVGVPPLHDVREAVSPQFEVHAEDFLHGRRPPGLPLLCTQASAIAS